LIKHLNRTAWQLTVAGFVCGLAGAISCNSEKKVASRHLKQYYECVTIAGPPPTGPFEGNARLEACLMSKGWNQDTAAAFSSSLSEVLVAGFTETAKSGRAAGDSVMSALSAERLRQAIIESMKSGLRDLVTSEEIYWGDHLKYTTIVGCSGQSRGAMFCVAEGNVLGPITLTSDGWTATMTHGRLPGVTCGIFIGSTPIPPATKEGLPTCQ
jgi:hypothetical protein